MRDAATVMLVRDGQEGRLEVLLQQRNLQSDFVGGAHVFPGGAVDASDRLGLGRHGAATDAECSSRLGLSAGGLAFFVAAVRECFEEAGLLLARRRGDDGALSFIEPEVATRFAAHRRAVNGGRPLVEVLAEEDLVLDPGLLLQVSHWVTPEGASRRYDTRFFVAAAPPEQVPLHDDGETVATLWIEPAEALDRHRRGELDLILPTMRNLDFLAGSGTIDHLLTVASAIGDVPTIRPRLVPDRDGSGVRILLPGERGYDEATPGGGQR